MASKRKTKAPQKGVAAAFRSLRSGKPIKATKQSAKGIEDAFRSLAGWREKYK